VNIIHAKRVGFLATGSEITSGEILNTNSQKMAQILLEHGVEIGEHVVVDDQEDNIAIGLNFLFQHHDAVIISGGLGPTSDDRTRFAISQFAKQELIFVEASWQRIVDRLSKRNIPIPENNRQQAWFPQNAVVFPNVNGTADGCYLPCQDKLLFMLPGPPRECLPLFKEYVLPILETHQFYTTRKLYRWRLMGVSESAIAQELEIVGMPYHLEFAYRAAYPYIDIKLMLDNTFQLETIISAITAVVQPYLITIENAAISEILKAKIAESNIHLSICDKASKGLIPAQLSTAYTWQKIGKVEDIVEDYCVLISGLESYWQPETTATSTEIHLELRHNGIVNKSSRTIYLRGQETMEYALEYTCHEIYKAWFEIN